MINCHQSHQARQLEDGQQKAKISYVLKLVTMVKKMIIEEKNKEEMHWMIDLNPTDKKLTVAQKFILLGQNQMQANLDLPPDKRMVTVKKMTLDDWIRRPTAQS